MAISSRTSLRSAAQEIRNEVADRANTAIRVGDEFTSLVDSIGGLGVVYDITSAEFGASPSASAAANATAIQAAMTAASAARGKVLVPPGTFNLSAELTLPDGSFLDLEIQEGATLDFSQLTTLPTREACITIGTHDVTPAGPDGVIALPALGANVVAGTFTVTFASAPSLSRGDIFILCDTDDYSWNANLDGSAGHNNRPYYHKGEQCRVAGISGSVVTVDQPLRDSYTAGANIELHRVNRSQVRISGGGKIVCSGTGLDVGIHVTNGFGLIQDIEVEGARYAGYELWRCKDLDLVDCRSTTFTTVGDEGSGLYMITCEDCWVRGGRYRSGKHGMSLTGGAVFNAVPNRRCGAEDATLVGTLTAADMHGHCDDCSYKNCEIDGGVSLGGQNCKVSGGSVRSASDQHSVGTLKGLMLRLREVRGGTLVFENIKLKLDQLSVQSGSDYPITLDTADAIQGVFVVCKDCPIDVSTYNIKLGYASAWAGSGGESALDVSGLICNVAPGEKPPQFIFECVDADGTAAFREVAFCNNRGLAPTPTNLRTRRLLYRSVEVEGSDNHGLLAAVVADTGVANFIDIIDCITTGNDASGIFISATSAANDVYATVKGCRSLNNGQDGAVSGASKSSLRAENIKSLELSGNTWGDVQGVQTQGILYSVVSTVTTLLGSGNKALGATLLRSAAPTNDREELTFVGTGTPEGVVTAPVGSLFIRKDGGAGTTRYFKESGSGNTGWVGK